jgi:parallel beta-helix repeat protein
MRARFSVLVVLVMVLTMLPGAAAGATPPDVLHLYDSVILDGDFSGSIIIWGNDVTLDCAGHTVSGPGWADPNLPDDVYPGITVAFEVAGATVKNCTVSGFGGGIILHGTGATVIDNVAHNNGVGVGVFSNGNLIKSNVSNDNESNGYLMQRAEGNLLEGNMARGNAAHFSLELADGNALVGNTVIGQGSDLAFEIAGSSGNTLQDNTVSGIGEGFSLFPTEDFDTAGPVHSNDNKLIGNLATGDGEVGFYLRGGSGNALAGNSASGFFDGFRLEDASDNTLTSNTATYNSNNGFSVYGGSENNFRENIADDNEVLGFALVSDGNWFTENEASGNMFGFYVEGNGNTLTENLSSRNDRGFALTRATHNNLSGNVALHNSDFGYSFWDNSSYNTVSENVAQHSDIGFLFANNSHSNTVVENVATTNRTLDAVQYDTSSNTFELNDFKRTLGF